MTNNPSSLFVPEFNLALISSFCFKKKTFFSIIVESSASEFKLISEMEC